MSVIFFLFSLVGVALSALGLYEYVGASQGIATQIPFCTAGGNFDCAALSQSAFGTILGIPLGSFGIVFYLWLAFFSILAGSVTLIDRRFAKGIFLLCGAALVVFSIYLFLVSKIYVGTLCPICLSLYAVNFGIFVLALIWARGEELRSLCLEALVACGKGIGAVRLPGATGQLIKATLLYLVISIALVRALPEFMLNKLLMSKQEMTALIKEWKEADVETLALQKNIGALEGDYAKGPDSAKIQIVEYSDMECPACRAIDPILSKVAAEFPDDVQLTFKNFPLDNACNKIIEREFHRYACYTAELSRCAGEQGKFWEAHSSIMSFPGFDDELESDLSEDLLRHVAQIGMDTVALGECLASDRQLRKIKSDIDEGIALQLEGTPAVFVNGRQVSIITEDALRELVAGLIDGTIS